MRIKLKLTPALKNSVTRDWRNHFPSLGVYKPMWLMKMHGPVVVGICLDSPPSRDYYKPFFHVHCLLRPWPSISLALDYQVRDRRCFDLRRQICLTKHTEEHVEAIEFLKNATPELDFTKFDWPRLVGMYCEYVRQKRTYNIAKYCYNIFADIILLARWCGHEDYARRCYDEALGLMRQWNPPIDLAEWQAGVDALTTREQLDEVLESEIVKHKLQHIPVYGFDPGGTAESITQAYVESWASP